jgi:hypothetical protein
MNNVDKRFPHSCPSCSSLLQVKKLMCTQCGTEVDGLFELPPLARLTKEEQEFILHFVKMSGSLKEMANHMDKSYPSVRNYLDEIINKLNQ